jgi:cytochrome c553
MSHGTPGWPKRRLSALSTAATLLAAALAAGCHAPPSAPDPIARGKAHYKLYECARCHGENREGSDMAPALKDLTPFWSVDTLSDYIWNPSKYRAGDDHVRDLVERYADIPMPGYEIPEEDRRELAAWLLRP